MYVLILIASFVLSYGVQLSYYIWEKRENPRAFVGQKTLLDYYTGWLGDGFIVPLINVLIYYVTVKMGYKLTPNDLLWAVGCALVLDFLTHFIQGKVKMTNWSMPHPFRWNFAGYWHMVSFPIQTTYLLLFFRLIVHNVRRLVDSWSVLAAIAGIFALMATFLVLYHFDNRRPQTASKILR